MTHFKMYDPRPSQTFYEHFFTYVNGNTSFDRDIIDQLIKMFNQSLFWQLNDQHHVPIDSQINWQLLSSIEDEINDLNSQ